MRRLIVVVLTLALLAAGALPAAAVAGMPVVLDGNQTAVTMDAETGLVALDQFAKAIGAEYTWVAERREATVVLGHRSAVLWADSPRAVLNGASRTLAAAPLLHGTTLMAPLVTVAEALGLFVAGAKDGALVVRTGLDLIKTGKAPNFTSDQVTYSRMQVKSTNAIAADPANSESFGFAVTTHLHIYQGQISLKMQAERDSDAPGTLEMVYLDGKSYSREDGGDWEINDEPISPLKQEIPEELAGVWGAAAVLDQSALKNASVSVTGTSEMDGVKVVHIMIASTGPAIMPFGVPGVSVAELPGTVNTSQRVQTYAIDLDTGIVHEAHVESSYRISDQILTADFQFTADLRVNPSLVPLELPADLPR